MSVARIAIMLVSVGVATTLAEGVWSLCTGDSLLFPRPILRNQMLDEERIKAAALTVGPFAVDEDPLVGFRTKPSLEREFWNVPATTDAFGMRKRLGPEPQPGAARIVVLGDSFAFGFGVKDDETLAHRLENVLAHTMRDGAPRPWVYTVACTGWTFANQARYLKNHLARIDPDIVITLPVANDLDDAYSVSEVGQRWIEPREGRPYMGVEYYAGFVAALAQRQRQFLGGRITWPLLLTDLSPESRRRWDEYVAGMRDLRDRLAARDAKFVIAYPDRDDFHLVARERLATAMPDLVQIGLLGPRGAEDCIEGDPHPNGRWYTGAAVVLGEFLLERKWVDGAGAKPLAKLEERYESMRYDVSDWRVEDEVRQAWQAVFGATVDIDEGTGFQQIYGGVDPADGTVGMSCMLGLHREDATVLQLRLTRLPVEAGVYPLMLSIHAGGREFERIEVEAPKPGGSPIAEWVIPLPVDVRDTPAVDVLLSADNWIAEQHQGRTRPAAFRLDRIELR